MENYTSFPSGKQRQKKSGRGRPTASFIASVNTAVIKTENSKPALTSNFQVSVIFFTYFLLLLIGSLLMKIIPSNNQIWRCKFCYLALHDEGHRHLSCGNTQQEKWLWATELHTSNTQRRKHE